LIKVYKVVRGKAAQDNFFGVAFLYTILMSEIMPLYFFNFLSHIIERE